MIRHIDDVGKNIARLQEEYEKGNIEAICVVIKTKDGQVQEGWSPHNYFERIGMIETLKRDMQLQADGCESY